MHNPTSNQQKSIAKVLQAIEIVKSGGMVIMVDDEDRENEGDLVFAASEVDSEKINFLAKEARGLICLAMGSVLIDRLHLPLMGSQRSEDGLAAPMRTAFTVSIEAASGVTTGISAADRAHTIKVAIDDKTLPRDIVVPGHVFPLKAKVGGVLERAGHTEGSVDLARLAGKKSAAVICEIMKEDGSMARLSDLEEFAKKFKLHIVSIEDLITFRLLKDTLVEEIARHPVETSAGIFEGAWFRNIINGQQHFALIKGKDFGENVVDVRVHKQRPLIDVFTSLDKGRGRVEMGLEMLKRSERAVFLYLLDDSPNHALEADRQELQGEVRGGVLALMPSMDPRLYGLGAQILRSLQVQKMRVHVSSQRSLIGLGGFGLEIVDMVEFKPEKEA